MPPKAGQQPQKNAAAPATAVVAAVATLMVPLERLVKTCIVRPATDHSVDLLAAEIREKNMVRVDPISPAFCFFLFFFVYVWS